MPFSTAIDNDILDQWTTKTAWADRTADTTWVALSDAAPTKDGTGTSEPSTGGYVRIQIPAARWTAGVSSSINNTTLESYPVATADYVAGADLTHVAYFSAVTSGTFLGSKLLTVAKPVTNGDTASFAIGALVIAMGGVA